ncbi:MAG: 2,5-dihydroxypyridine 5,6-dioxygenase [Alphaproteobacteria bacterium]|nr:2,5-dihydroxypyridine 5,6-dioxygenase [Alphaproteobacteria bacterium]
MTVNLARMWREVLDLCRLRFDETVVILDRSDRGSRYAQVAVQAAETVAAEATFLQVADASALPAAALAAISQADLLIDLAFSHDLRLLNCLEEGMRTLVAVEPVEILARMFPTPADKRRCIAACDLLAAASSLRVTSEAGTDFSVALGVFRARYQCGFSDEPGRWDQWPGAFVYTYPNEGSANGTIVIDRGDILFPTKSYVQSPIRLTVENGYIVSIDGGFDAQYLADVLKSYSDPEVYAVAHLGWGLSHNGRWNVLGMYDKADIEGQDGRAFLGNFLFSTGPNVQGGGKRATPCHFDMPMRHCSIFLDERPIVRQGEVVFEEK